MVSYLDISNGIRDDVNATLAEIDLAAMVNLVKAVLWEFEARGILVEKSQETAVARQITFTAADPGLVYFKQAIELKVTTDVYESIIQRWRYHLVLDVGVAKFEFTSSANQPSDGKVRLEGLAPIDVDIPGLTADLTDTVPEGFEGHVQQGLLAAVLGRLSQGEGELAQDRAEQRREERLIFEETLNQLAAAQVSRLREGEFIRIPGK